MRTSIIILAIFYLSSCTGHGDKSAPAAGSGMPAVQPAGTADITAADPVCGMPVDSSWTDSTVYQNHTLRFCSEGCKKAFLARPNKYLKNSNKLKN